jgi:hypothetical protein
MRLFSLTFKIHFYWKEPYRLQYQLWKLWTQENNTYVKFQILAVVKTSTAVFGVWHCVVLQVVASILKECTASIFRVQSWGYHLYLRHSMGSVLKLRWSVPPHTDNRLQDYMVHSPDDHTWQEYLQLLHLHGISVLIVYPPFDIC